jgi:MFS family permease
VCLVLSSFYWGYALGQIPSVLFAQIYGAKWLFGFSVLFTSIFTLFVPIAAESSVGWTLCLRCLIGLFESASFPAVFYFFPFWVPRNEKTFLIPFTYCGMYVGEILGFSLSGYLVESVVIINGVDFGGWASVFYVFSIAGILWFPLWAYIAYDKPDDHPYISNEELEYIHKHTDCSSLMEKSRDGSSVHEKSYSSVEPADHLQVIQVDRKNNSRTSSLADDIYPLKTIKLSDSDSHTTPLLSQTKPSTWQRYREIPWFAIFTNKSSLTNFACSWVFGFIGFMLLSEMPSYLTDELNFDLESAGMLCIAPYAGMFIVAMALGKIFDSLQINYPDQWPARRVRQWAQFIAFGGSGGMLLICGFVDSNKYLAYVFIVLGQAVLGACQIGIGCVYLEISPRYSSIMNTIGNTLGAMAGIVGPIVVALFIDTWHGIWGWRAVFIMTAAMCSVALILWSKYQTSDIIPELNTPVSAYSYSLDKNEYQSISDVDDNA